MAKKSIAEVDLTVQRTLVRVDFNVPLEDGQITDITRIQGALPTIQMLTDAGCPVTLCSHMGRPKGERDEALSLAPVATKLGEILGTNVQMAPDCVGDEVAQMRSALGAGEVLLLENTRFHAAEKANEAGFARALAGDAELYVDDAFGSMHRAHASTVGVTDVIGDCVAGLLVRKELDSLTKCRDAEGDGFIVILGGAKAEDKIKAITQLLPRVEKLLIGGAMAWAFFSVQGKNVGESLCKPDSVEAAAKIMDETDDALLERLMLPLDVHMKQVEPDTGETVFADADGIKADGTRWISARRRSRSMGGSSATRRRSSSGTARWATSRRSPSTRGRSRSGRRSLTPTPTRSSGAATRRRRSTRWASMTRCHTSRPAAGRRWSTSRARACRGSRRSTTSETQGAIRRRDRRLETSSQPFRE